MYATDKLCGVTCPYFVVGDAFCYNAATTNNAVAPYGHTFEDYAPCSDERSLAYTDGFANSVCSVLSRRSYGRVE